MVVVFGPHTDGFRAKYGGNWYPDAFLATFEVEINIIMVRIHFVVS